MPRCPAVAGSFYEASSEGLRQQVGALLHPDVTGRSCLGVISPHAGYSYSGNVAGLVYSSVVVPESAVILAPNHTGLGRPAADSADSSAVWVQ